VQFGPIVVSLPVLVRQRSYDFYHRALGLEAIGEAGEDGLPEPLQFVVNDGLRLMLPPRDGFGYTIGEGHVATRGNHECVLVIGIATPAEAEAIMEQAVTAGAVVVAALAVQPWGYAGSFADPDGHIWMVRAGQTSTA